MSYENMTTADILVLWAETCESRKSGSWMTYDIDTKVIEACIKALSARGYFAAKAAESNLARTATRGPEGHFTEID
jgi:hypothetical protein